jgi:hypothetical protein
MTVITDLKTLYEIDDSLWLEETIELLKKKRFDALDLENLIEELEDLGNEKSFVLLVFYSKLFVMLCYCNFGQGKENIIKAHWKAETSEF